MDTSRLRAGKPASIADAVGFNAVWSVAYCVIMARATDPPSLSAKAVQWWLEVTAPLTVRLSFLTNSPPGLGASNVRFGGLYGHIVLVSLFSAVGVFLMCLRHIPDWSAVSAPRLLQFIPSQGSFRQAAIAAHVHMVIGCLATLFVLVYADHRPGSLASILGQAPWTFFRAPFLSTLALAFALQAAAIRGCIGPLSGED